MIEEAIARLAPFPRTGERAALQAASSGAWISSWTDGPDDVVYLLRE